MNARIPTRWLAPRRRAPIALAIPLVLCAASPSAAAQNCGLSFQPTSYPAGVDPIGVAVGDLDGDARADLVVGATGSNALAVLLGAGGGVFAPAQLQPAGPAPRAPALGDLNGDGALDAVATSFATDTVAVLLGDGAGALGLLTAYAVGADPTHVELADLDVDGALDFASANYAGKSVTVRLGIGDGTFGPEQVHSFALTGFYGTVPHIDAGDLNGDGLPDVAVAARLTDQMPLLINQGGGILAPGSPAPVAAGFAEHVALGDVNADGKLDYHIENEDIVFFSRVVFETRLGNGDGTFCCLDWLIPPDYSHGSELVDVDGDGKLDHVSFVLTALVAKLGNGAGKFPGGAIGTDLGASHASAASGDFDQDGFLDLAATSTSLDAVTVVRNQYFAVVSIQSVVPASVACLTLEPVELTLTGCFLHLAHTVVIDGVIQPAGSFSSPGTGKLKVAMPLVSKLGPVEIRVVTPVGAATGTVQVTAPPSPLIQLATTGPLHFLSPATGAHLKTGVGAGDLVFLLTSPDAAPSSLPGLLSVDLGAAFTSLALLATAPAPGKGWFEQHFSFAGVPIGTLVYFQAVVLEAPGFALPLESSNLEFGIISN